MVLVHPAHGILVDSFFEDALIVPPLRDLGDDEVVELRVTLDCDELVLDIHALNRTARCMTELLNSCWIFVDNVAVHLEDVLVLTSALQHARG